MPSFSRTLDETVHAGAGLRGQRSSADNSGMDLAQLRVETRHEHESVEARMPLTAPDITVETYARVLAAMYPVLAGWEQWAAANAPSDLKGLVADRKRKHLLELDLVALCARVPKELHFDGNRLPGVHSDDADKRRAAFLGAMYVIEGSTLGGQHIARHVEPRLGLSPERGTAYFRGYGDGTGERWTHFKSILQQVPNDHADTVINSAKATFVMFEEAIAPVTVLLP